MYVPVPAGPAVSPEDNDHRDLITALRLLSGEGCLRDARQAHTMLVGLTESRHTDVAADARGVMQRGLAQGWFDATTPKYFELRLLAERSIAAYEKPTGTAAATRQMVLVGLGLFMALVMGVVAFMYQSGGDDPPFPIVAVVVGMLIVGLGVVVLLKSRTR